jgi:lysylphosphatidylglycerol synthetase-like protein (DUF2156 family)
MTGIQEGINRVVSILVVFYMFLILFAIIGAMRGWAKELLVAFSVILAMALIAILETLIPVVRDFLTRDATIQFWSRTVILTLLVFFGYQSPKLSQFSKAASRRDQIQDVLLGLILGLISGYLIVGSLWSFMVSANYPFAPYITAPQSGQPLGDTALRIVNYLPPVWLGKVPNIFIAVVFAFIFVIVVFI